MGTYINNSSSSSSKATASAGGIGFFGLLFIALMVLKLTNIIDWSWWWITAPLWGPFVLVILILIVWFLILMK